MNKKVQQNYATLAQNLGFSFDIESNAMYGERGGYAFLIKPQDSKFPYMLSVTTSVQQPIGSLTKEICKQFKAENKPVDRLMQNGTLITMSLKQYSNQTTLHENLESSITAFIDLLHKEGFQNSCQSCGNQDSSMCYVSGSFASLCPECFLKLQNEKSMNYMENQGKSENIVAGIVGAFLGSLLGVIAIIIFSQLGYVAVASGIIMAIFTLKGYEKLAGKLTKKGIIISIILMIVMTIIGDQLDWSIYIVRELGIDYFTAFRMFIYMLGEGMIDRVEYFKHLILLFVFVILGAVPSIIATLKNKKVENRIYRLGSYTQNNEYDKM